MAQQTQKPPKRLSVLYGVIPGRAGFRIALESPVADIVSQGPRPGQISQAGFFGFGEADRERRRMFGGRGFAHGCGPLKSIFACLSWWFQSAKVSNSFSRSGFETSCGGVVKFELSFNPSAINLLISLISNKNKGSRLNPKAARASRRFIDALNFHRGYYECDPALAKTLTC